MTSPTVVTGDILSAPNTTAILHQCNCRTRTSAGLARAIFEKWPIANVYSGTHRLDPDRRAPGRIHSRRVVMNDPSQSTPFIIAMFAQDTPGYNRTNEPRLMWFNECLRQVAEALRDLHHNLTSVAIPYGIGCGLAGGNWGRDYWPAIQAWAATCPLPVMIYRRAIDFQHPTVADPTLMADTCLWLPLPATAAPTTVIQMSRADLADALIAVDRDNRIVRQEIYARIPLIPRSWRKSLDLPDPEPAVIDPAAYSSVAAARAVVNNADLNASMRVGALLWLHDHVGHKAA